MRFRKSIQLCKGVKLNISKSGPSLTVGRKGISFNVGGKGAFVNWSIPGTGVYDRVRVDTLIKDKLGEWFGGEEPAPEEMEAMLAEGPAPQEADEEPKAEKKGKSSRSGKSGRKAEEKKAEGATEEEQLEVIEEQAFIEIAGAAPDVRTRAEEGELDSEEAERALEDWLSEAESPVEFSIEPEIVPEKNALMIDLDLPELEDMPHRKLTKLKSGVVKIKDKSKKEQLEDYKTCVFGLGMYVAAHTFNLIPQAERVLISAYTQRRDAKTGDRLDVFLYTLVFERKAFKRGYQKKDPYDFCSDLRGRFYVLASGAMKEITPFEAEDI